MTRGYCGKGDNFGVLELEEERQRLSYPFPTMVIIISVPNSLLSVRIPLRKPGMVSLQVVSKAGACRCEKTLLYRECFCLSTGYKGEELLIPSSFRE